MPTTAEKRNKEMIFKWYRKRIDNRMWGAFEKSLDKIEKVALVCYFR
jgi:2-oxo-4-hydroxy-4-carboxy--5-ureidoimidazoline (OHCU) decarboxylase